MLAEQYLFKSAGSGIQVTSHVGEYNSFNIFITMSVGKLETANIYRCILRSCDRES
jgi:hypothetical protein